MREFWYTGAAAVLSACVHLSVWAIQPPPEHKKYKPVRFRMIKRRPRPVKRPVVRPKTIKRRLPPRPRPKPRKKIFRKRKRIRRRPPPPPQKRIPPPPNRTPRRPPPRNAPPPRPIFGVTMSSLAKGPGARVAVRVGNTVMKDPDRIIVDPRNVRSYAAPRRVLPLPQRRQPPKDVFRPVPVYEVDENPKERKKFRAAYPVIAKRRGVEAKVTLSIQIRRNGRVRRARVISVRPASARGLGFGKAAVKALLRFRFRPARYKGKAVDIVVRYIYRFELED